ncbi:MAG: HD domain-containing protein [Flavobacteriales bacterium]|nr:HD domain-containing protein [Flavobacteriales bacterium]MCB9204670.1 HD domain-containing protein [Flavobacteriales bacterium]
MGLKYNKRKILNDPVYGFITVPYPIVFDIIEHPFFQRLRRIKQLGLTHLVYPGALHTRFHHTLGAMHLIQLAIEELRSKGYEISDDEAVGVTLAILMHDIGHGPFSHALEHSIVSGVTHEDLSALFMEILNEEFEGKLDMAIAIFNDKYPKRFLHQLVSSQLDMDRLDYLRRDSFFTGVSEGVIGSDRIIKMLHVVNDELAVESKGIYSIEKFIVARRIMYWQVYLHKTVLSAEYLLIYILKRAKELAESGVDLFATPALKLFLQRKVTRSDFQNEKSLLNRFAELDDFDVLTSVKVWKHHDDPVLSRLSEFMVDRKLLKIKMFDAPVSESILAELRKELAQQWGISEEAASYFVFTDSIANSAYNLRHDRINILFKNGEVKDITRAADTLSLSVLSKPVEKHFLCYPSQLKLTNQF